MQGRPDAIDQVRALLRACRNRWPNWLTLLADDSWQLVLNDAYGYLNKRYRHELYGFYKESLFKRYPFSAKSDSDVAIADFREFFKADGVADAFVDRYLKAFVSDSEGKYQLRRLDGQGLPLSPVFLAQMTDPGDPPSFFAENPAEPLVLFKLEPFALDYSVNRADFQFGGQQLEYRHGPIIASAFRWPAEGENERSSLVLEEQGGRRVGIGKDSGPWALFRLLDQMQVEQHSGRDVLLLKANLSGLQANYLLHSQRSPNPFDASLLRQFKLPGDPLMQVAQRLWSSAGRTDTGKVRARNEDAFLDQPQQGLWVVADGMGGHQAGDLASRLIVESLAELPAGLDFEDRLDALRDRLHRLNRHLSLGLTLTGETPDLLVGSTVVALLRRG